MNGAQRLLQVALQADIKVCFANPGTTELTLVNALDATPGMRAVLGLFEGVVTGAADGYGRMAGSPALTLTHLGPSFSNGLANLHNARRARSPVVNLVGDHPRWHRQLDPPLAMDIEGVARPVSSWVRTTEAASTVARDAAAAIFASKGPPGSVATLILPADCQWNETGDEEPLAQATPSTPVVSPEVVSQTAALLRAHSSVLLLGGTALSERGLRAAARVAVANRCRLMAEGFPAKLERGGGLPSIPRIPYIADFATAAFEGVSHVILAGCHEPVPYFAYPNEMAGRRLIPGGLRISCLIGPEGEAPLALEALADELCAPPYQPAEGTARPGPPRGPLTSRTLMAAIASTQPDRAIIVDEGVSLAGAYLQTAPSPAKHTYLSLTGGACGQGLPCAAGAAIACPDRPVVAIVGDGSALYTLQALWTHAREGLDITTVVCANNAYRILQLEQDRFGDVLKGGTARRLTELQAPSIQWSGIADGFGVPATRATSTEQVIEQLQRAFAEPGPHLLEVCLK